VSRESVGYAREIEHANSLGYALAWSACTLTALSGDAAETARLADALVAHAEKNALDLWRAYGVTYQAWAMAETGAADGIARLRQAVASLKESGGCLRLPSYLGALAWNLGRQGRPDEGLAVIEEALAQVAESGERWCEAELIRIKGELLLAARGSAAEAEALFGRALDIARRQSARSWELRAAASLAALWRDQGRRTAARDLLAPVYDGFTEGADTADLKAARMLLDGLGDAAEINRSPDRRDRSRSR
jgi:predicted ATPase